MTTVKKKRVPRHRQPSARGATRKSPLGCLPWDPSPFSWFVVVLILISIQIGWVFVGPALACTKDGALCKVSADCCSGFCAPRVGQGAICVAGPVTTVTISPASTTTTSTTVHVTTTTIQLGQSPIRPTGADLGQALLAGKGQFYVWYRGQLADQPIRDAMQQYLTGVMIPDLLLKLETTCPQAINKAVGSPGGIMNVVYRRLGNIYENLSDVWSIGPQGRNYSLPEGLLEDLRDCLIGKLNLPTMTVSNRDALTIHLDPNGRYARWDAQHPSFYIFPQPKANETIGKRAPVNVHLSFPPIGTGLTLLHAADSAHAAASGIGTFPQSVDQAAQAYETNAKSRDELHFRQMKRFTGFCDPHWGTVNCLRWKAIQHHFFACWTAAEAAGNWRDARNCDSDHQLSHICTNYMSPTLDVRFSIPGVDEHLWPITNCQTALAKLGG